MFGCLLRQKAGQVMDPVVPSFSARRPPKKEAYVDHVPSRDSEICIQTGYSSLLLMIHATTTISCNKYRRVRDVI